MEPMWINAPVLKGTQIQLEPLDESHRESLRAIAEDEAIWRWYPTNPLHGKFDAWFDLALTLKAEGTQVPYVVRDLSNQAVVGSTRYLNLMEANKRLEIGSTWYVQSVWGTKVNPEAKLLLLTYAFETLDVNRVELVTDALNARSRAAIKKLGAQEEGILRQHVLIWDGRIRDTVMHSIVRNEWAAAKASLVARLA